MAPEDVDDLIRRACSLATKHGHQHRGGPHVDVFYEIDGARIQLTEYGAASDRGFLERSITISKDYIPVVRAEFINGEWVNQVRWFDSRHGMRLLAVMRKLMVLDDLSEV